LAGVFGFSFVELDGSLKGVGNLQAEARKIRYNSLAELANEKSAVVFLAHHANDLVETKIHQLLTGRQVTGIQRSMIWHDAEFRRPLLYYPQISLSCYSFAFGLKWCTDSTNLKDKYSRNKIRHTLIPWVEKNINPGIVKSLSKPDQ
jgi:tRNA(Ile)-lysidine synthase